MHCFRFPPPKKSGQRACSSIAHSSNTAQTKLMKGLFCIVVSALLTNCALHSPSPIDESSPTDPQLNAEGNLPANTQKRSGNERQETPTVSSRPFPADTLYTLLVAEIAGNRKHYHLALANYYKQAERTKDAGVAARATHIARYLNARRTALNSAELWVELEPENLEAQLAVTIELTLAAEVERALAHAGKVLALDGDAPLQSLAIAATSQTGLALKVTPRFRRLSEQYPQNHEAALALVILLRAGKEYQEAMSIIRRVQRQQPDLLDAPLLLSHLLIDLKRSDKARKLLENVLEAHPKASRLRLQYARLLVREDLTLARQQFVELVEQRPTDGNMLLSLALIQFETDNADEAKLLFERLLALKQHDSAANYGLGRIAEQRGQITPAVDHYRKVGPGGDYVAAITHGTELLVANGETQVAGSWFSELRERHSSRAEQFYLLEAELLHKFAFHEEARIQLGHAVEEHSGSRRLIYAHAMASEQAGDSAGFEVGLRKLLSNEPNNASLLNSLGYNLLADDARLKEALVLISKALKLSPKDPAIIDSMGWVQYRLGNHDEAVKFLQEAMQQLPNHEIAAHLGEALWAQGNRQQAMAVWKQGLLINPKSEVISEAIQRLQDKQNVEQHVSET